MLIVLSHVTTKVRKLLVLCSGCYAEKFFVWKVILREMMNGAYQIHSLWLLIKKLKNKKKKKKWRNKKKITLKLKEKFHKKRQLTELRNNLKKMKLMKIHSTILIEKRLIWNLNKNHTIHLSPPHFSKKYSLEK